jgi:hypothetical protein
VEELWKVAERQLASVHSGFGRDITADMPKERFFPPVRVGWSLTLGLLLFMAGIFYVGIYPTPIMDALQDASRSLFVS